MSVWLLVAITVDRYLAVCHPFAVRTYSTRGRAMLTIAVIVVFSIVYNLVRFWEFEPVADRWHDPNVTGVNNLIQPLLRESSLYMLLYQNAATMITQFVLPLFVLGALNLQVARTILRAGVERKQLVASEKREHSTAKMMLYVVIVFLVCYVFSFVLNVIETLHTELFNADVGYFLNDVNNFLVVVNSSSSFCFYCKYSTRFRTELHRLTGLTLPPCCGTTPVQSARGSGPAATTTTECSHLVSPPPQAPLADRSFNSCIIEDDEKVIDLQGDDDEAVVIANDSSTDHSLLPSPPVAVSNGSAARHHHHHQHHHHQPSLAPVVTFERTTNV